MVREFQYKGEIFRVTAHGIRGHEEIFVVHIDKDGVEGGETSIDRMTEENDTCAPLEDILVMPCDRLTPDIDVQDPNGPFAWREGNVVFQVHDGLQATGHEWSLGRLEVAAAKDRDERHSGGARQASIHETTVAVRRYAAARRGVARLTACSSPIL